MGQVQESWKHGQGAYVNSNGTFGYFGEFEDDLREGKGVLILGPDF